MSFKSNPVAVGTGSTTVYECPAGTEAAGKVGIANISGSAATYDLLFYSAVLNQTIALASGIPIAANTEVPAYPSPLSFVGGDRLIARASVANAITIFATVTESNQGPQFTGISPKGEWASGTTYAVNDMVSLNGTSYLSRIDGNVGNSPDTSTADWVVLASAGGLPDNALIRCATRIAIAALNSTDTVVYLYETGREGVFVWSGADLSAEVALDTAQGIYVPPSSDTTGASGAWVRGGDYRLSVNLFGAKGDGAADDTTAISAALAFIENGGALYFPAGTYKITSDVSATIASGKKIALIGDGADLSIIHSPSGEKFTINYTDITSALNIVGLSRTTGTTNVGTGFALVQLAGSDNPAASAQTVIRDVTIRGNDGYASANYFATGISVDGVSQINFDSVLMPGNASIAGDGVTLAGDAINGKYGVVYNFNGCTFNFLAVGVLYNSYIQGVAFNNCNFTGDVQGVVVPSGATGELDQLSVVNSQFACTNTCINANELVLIFNLANSVLQVAADNAFCVIGKYSSFSIAGNTLLNTTHTGNDAIVLADGSINGIVTGNNIRGFAFGVVIQTGADTINVQSNVYNGVTTPVSNSGTNCTVGGGSS